MNNFKKWVIGIALVLVAVVAVAPTALNKLVIDKQLNLPQFEPVEVHWVEQNWSSQERQDWYHKSQGSALEAPIPYDWFGALEQPHLRLFGETSLLIAPEYMGRFGFLSSENYEPANPENLPVGFAKTEKFINWQTGRPVGDVVGFTCAACHTGQINFQGKGIRIEGGSAVTDLNKFKTAAGLALTLTATAPIPSDKSKPWYQARVKPFLVGLMRFADTPFGPSRFDRFADHVLGPNNTPEARKNLKEQLNRLVTDSAKLNYVTSKFYPATAEQGEEGFARLDALDRIGNFVFGTEVTSQNPEAGTVENYTFADAPVNYPPIWLSSWFDWVQYNGSIMQPMTRNAGEAMGVFSRVNFDANSEEVFHSNLNIQNLYEIENSLAGASACATLRAPDCPEWAKKVLDTTYFSGEKAQKPGLAPPPWPEEILGPIDRDKAARGKVLFEENCVRCHLPSVKSAEIWNDEYWQTISPSDVGEYASEDEAKARKYLKVNVVGLYDIGTDPTTALNWYQRVTDLGKLPQQYPPDNPERRNLPEFDRGGITSAGFALPYLVDRAVDTAYEVNEIPPDKWDSYNGYRPSKVRAPFGYKAPPLSGVWATPPYLHNGSVPNLYELLSPVEERSDKFYLGTKEFDPKYVGYLNENIPGTFLLDTSYQGNSNKGHEFKDGGGMGVIGPAFSEEERWELIEYLKTL